MDVEFRRATALSLGLGLAVLAAPTSAHADTFEPGSLIIPMDTDYQDEGMFRAYGLVYQLRSNDVPVRWAIRGDKDHEGTDFSAAATDLASGDPIPMHDYRGGPWVIDASDAAEALPIIEAWQADNPAVAVHEASGTFVPLPKSGDR